MADDVILDKAESIERCLHRITEEFAADRQNLAANQTKQDAIVLNLIITTDLADFRRFSSTIVKACA